MRAAMDSLVVWEAVKNKAVYAPGACLRIAYMTCWSVGMVELAQM
jgi:hypothetical protein